MFKKSSLQPIQFADFKPTDPHGPVDDVPASLHRDFDLELALGGRTPPSHQAPEDAVHDHLGIEVVVRDDTDHRDLEGGTTLPA